MQHISNFVHKRIFSTEERNMKGRDLLRPWLVADRKIQLLSLPDTQSFVTDLCWGSGVPVEGIPGKRSQPVASDSAALKSAAEQFNHVYSGLLDALPRIDADRLSEAGRDAPIKVYKMLRSSAVASEKLVTEAMREASGRSQEVQNVMERRKGKGLIVDYMDSEIDGSDTLLDATHNGDGSIDSTAAVALAAILGYGSVDKLLYTLRSLVTLDGKNYLMADDVRRQMLSVGSTPAENMLLKGKGKQAAASSQESNKTPNVMFHCGEEISVSVDAAAAASASATDFYKRRANHVLRFFSERQLVSLREAYEDLAAAEELHMKMSYMFADCSAALVDLSDCMRFLLDRFGCNRWSQGVMLRDNIYPGPSMYADPDSELHRPVLHEFEAAPRCKLTVTVDKLTRKNANIDELKQELTSWIGETRDPFVLVELVKKENRERLGVLDHSANSYMSDVHAIRIFIAEALNLQKKSKSAATDAENRGKLHDMVCRLARRALQRERDPEQRVRRLDRQ
jgi:hypothetical protein